MQPGADITADEWEGLRTLYVQRAPRFLSTALGGWERRLSASWRTTSPTPRSATFASGCGPVQRARARRPRRADLAPRRPFASAAPWRCSPRQELPHSLGLLYEELTAHLGFRRSSDEYKVMAMASYGEPALPRGPARAGVRRRRRRLPRRAVDSLADFAPPLRPGEEFSVAHAAWRARCSGGSRRCCWSWRAGSIAARATQDLVLAGGVALNCVANSRLWREGPFSRVWVQPASGDSGTALGAALHVAHALGDAVAPMRDRGAGPRVGRRRAGRGAGDRGRRVQRARRTSPTRWRRCSPTTASWPGSRAAREFGPRALGHRSLLADPRRPENLEKLNDIKGREQFRPVAPMVLAERASEIFRDGPIPSPVHALHPRRARRSGATASRPSCTSTAPPASRPSTASDEPLVARMLECFEARTGVPVVVNTSLNTAGRPMVDDPRDALECFGSSPVDALAIGPFLLHPSRACGRPA